MAIDENDDSNGDDENNDMDCSYRSHESTLSGIARRDSNGLITIPASSLDSDSVKDGVLLVVPCPSSCDCYGDNSRRNSELLTRSRDNSVKTAPSSFDYSINADLSLKTVNVSMQQQHGMMTLLLYHH